MSVAGIIGCVFLGGGLGSLSRYGVSIWSLKWYNGQFPLGTLLANVLACITLGLTMYFFKDKLQDSEWIKYTVLIGFCGGFSTFSTFSIETVRLIQDQFYGMALLNIIVSVLLGVGILMILVKS